MDVLSTAKAYIASGIKCLPVIKESKKPRVPNWSKDFLDESRFNASFKSGDGVGIVTGKCSQIICIDIDKKSNGLEWFEKHKDSLGSYLREDTPGGGLHLYYPYPGGYSFIPSCNNYAPGVEIKADGGRYVITAPSGHPNGGTYKIWNNILLTDVSHEAGPFPDWILKDLLARQEARLKAPEPPTNELPIEGDILGATTAIAIMPPAIAGRSGDNQTYVAACKCRDYGLTQLEAYQVLREHFNPRCSPPWSDKELKQKIINAYTYGLNPPGVRVQANDKPVPYIKARIQEFMGTPFQKREHIIGPFVRQGLNMVYAPAGVGKTYFSLSLAFAIATKGNFLNWKCEIQQKVIYFDGELTGALLQERLGDLIKHSGSAIGEDVHFEIVTPDQQKQGMPDLASEEGQFHAVSLIGNSDFIVIDNISTLCRTGKENEAESWIPVQNWLLKLRTMGKSVLLVHHAGKGDAITQRGTSKREDVLDLIIRLSHPVGYTSSEACKFEMKFTKSRHFRDMDDTKELIAAYGPYGWEVQDLETNNKEKVSKLYHQCYSNKEIAETLKLSKGYVSKIVKELRDPNKIPDEAF